MKKTYIISLGGSLMVPPVGIDTQFLKKFRSLILEQVKQGSTFYLIAGGGATCRNYIQAASKVVKIEPEDLDWLGIHTTRLNAHLLRTIFRDVAHPEIIKNPTFRLASHKKVVIAGGWKPGWSTDYMAAMIAQEYEADTVINLSNIDYAYDKDPRKFKDAKKITEIGWNDFCEMVGSKWIPGMNAPFDPIASKKARQLGLEVLIMNGRNLANLKKYFATGKFIGTRIK